MKKRILSVLIAAALWVATLTSAAVLPTALAAESSDDLEEAVTVLTGLGIVSGYPDGLYHPEDSLTRAQFCKLAVLCEGHESQVKGSAYRSLFSDVPSSSWALSYINLAYEEGLVAGKGNGTFGPEEPVTLDQAATVCLRLLGYSDSDIGPFWPEDYLSMAEQVGLLDGLSARAGEALDRGEAALLLYNLLRLDDTQGKMFGLRLGSVPLNDVILLGCDEEAPDGSLHTALVYSGASLQWYGQSSPLDAGLAGQGGTLLLDKAGKVSGFIPNGSKGKTLTAATVTASAVKDASGNSHSVSQDVSVVLEGEKKTYGSVWYELEGRDLTLFYGENGGVTLVSASESTAYEGVTLTGYYESASPNLSDPSSITLLGCQFDVAEDASGLSGRSIGDKITVALNGSGEVEQVWSASEKKADVIAILDSAAKGTFTHVSGISLTSEVTNSSTAEGLEGCLVKVNASGVGKCSVSALSGGTTSTLDLTAGKLGSLPLADDIKVYDQVGSAPVVEIGLDDILTAAVKSDKITYVGTNERGEVDLLLLKDVTRDGYSYGFYWIKTVTASTSALGSGGTETYTYQTVALENSQGTTKDIITIQPLRSGTAGGLAVTAAEKIAGYESLTKVTGVSRSAFHGEEYVVLDGMQVPLAGELQVYNEDSEVWTDLASARGYSETLTVYYSGTLGTDAKVRMVVTE